MAAGNPNFATTQWSVVLAAGQGGSPDADAALATLCRSYWYPLYAFVRRKGYGPDDAQDLTQAFFARLLEKSDLRAADRERGRFRSFLLACLSHFLANERDRAQAQKRGGGATPLSLDFADAEDRYQLEPGDDWTPERVFARRWALTLLDTVLARLRDEQPAAGDSARFARLKAYLDGSEPAGTYAETARDLDMTEGAVKVAVHRLRQRYRDLLRAEIAATLDDPAGIDDEIRDLFAALGE